MVHLLELPKMQVHETKLYRIYVVLQLKVVPKLLSYYQKNQGGYNDKCEYIHMHVKFSVWISYYDTEW